MADEYHLTIGIMPLTDAVSLVVAEAKGFFAEQGLRVVLVQEQSWATIRDKILFHAFDAAQMLAPMPLVMSFGGVVRQTPLVPLVLDLNGNGITVSADLLRLIRLVAPASLERRPIRADGVGAVVRARERKNAPKLVFGVVFPSSTHHVQLRWWLEDGGVDPDRDVEIVVVPPSQMAAELQGGRLDGYCVGEPWNQLAVRAGIGYLLTTSYELWQNGAEKVLCVDRRFAERRPEALQALLRAVIRAGVWLDRPDNRLEAAKLLVEGGWVAAPIEVIGLSLMGVVADGLGGPPRYLPDMHVFSRYAANFPWLSQAMVYAEAMVASGQLQRMPTLGEVGTIYRPDLFRAAAQAVGCPVPQVDWKTEGGHASSWWLEQSSGNLAMGPDSFFDGRCYPIAGNAARETA